MTGKTSKKSAKVAKKAAAKGVAAKAAKPRKAVAKSSDPMGTPVCSHEGMYALANGHKDKVKLTFFLGAELTDPKKLFNAGLDGSKWRAIDFREGDKLDKPALKALLREAVASNTRHSVPKSKGSRAWQPWPPTNAGVFQKFR